MKNQHVASAPEPGRIAAGRRANPGMRNRLLILAAVAWLYMTARFVWYLPGGDAARIPAAIALLLIAEYQQITSRWFGTFVSPELPRPMLIALGYAFGALFILLPLLLLRDVAGGIAYLVMPPLGNEIWTRPGIARGIGVLAGAAALVGTWQGIRIPGIKAVHIRIPGLPVAFNGYRIVQLSDLHASRLLPATWIARVVAKANALAPDLMVITGDLADGTPRARAADVAPYATLHARDGLLAIPGNHEYYADYRDWMAAYDRLGLPMLANRRVLITRGADSMAVAGLTDRQSRVFGEPPPDLDAALAGIPPGVPVILLDHQPAQRARQRGGGRRATAFRPHPRRPDSRNRDDHPTRQPRLHLRVVPGRHDAALCQQRHRSLERPDPAVGHPSEITELVLHAPDPGHAERVAARQGVAAQPAA
ncbi:MAG: metallophosphoesterase [Rhodanobacteraceae bacterium]